ncbi:MULTISPECIES: hypothetical protein [unclassified Sphingopyxis]|uniref:hypothetical protein n=1 Tax=unclassified Sphingopyxis TaxID=2614943 RepID=UPI000A75C720|nr:MULTISPECIES: hypothetical protein [unclassified Sphingopyxis]
MVAALLLAAAPAADTAPPVPAPEPIAAMVPMPESADTPIFQVVIEQQLIIRVPAQRSQLNNFAASRSEAPRVRQQAPIVWKETKAPKCVAMRNIVGMQAVQRDSIELITRQKERLRAQLNRGCRALDFYAGFYMKGNKDGKLCEDRDEIHARSGTKCEVDKFRLLVAVRGDD